MKKLLIAFLLTVTSASANNPDWIMEARIPCFFEPQIMYEALKIDGFIQQSSGVFFGTNGKHEGITQMFAHPDQRFVQLGIFSKPVPVVCVFARGNMFKRSVPDT